MHWAPHKSNHLSKNTIVWHHAIYNGLLHSFCKINIAFDWTYIDCVQNGLELFGDSIYVNQILEIGLLNWRS